jgi:hypothetical protein
MPPTQYIDVIPWEKRLRSSRKLRGNSKNEKELGDDKTETVS